MFFKVGEDASHWSRRVVASTTGTGNGGRNGVRAKCATLEAGGTDKVDVWSAAWPRLIVASAAALTESPRPSPTCTDARSALVNRPQHRPDCCCCCCWPLFCGIALGADARVFWSIGANSGIPAEQRGSTALCFWSRCSKDTFLKTGPQVFNDAEVWTRPSAHVMCGRCGVRSAPMCCDRRHKRSADPQAAYNYRGRALTVAPHSARCR